MGRSKRSDRLFILFFCLLGAGALAAPSDAVETTQESTSSVKFSAIDHVIFTNSKDAPDATPTSIFMHEAAVGAQYDPYSVDIHFSNRYTPDTNLGAGPVKPFVLEKATAGADWQNWNVIAGDSHQELGRGIALSLFQDKTFGIDNTVQGASVRYHPLGVDTSVFAGRIAALTVPVAINPIESMVKDRDVYLGGGSLKVDVAKQTKVGAQVMVARQRPLATQQFDKQWSSFGGSLQQSELLPDVDFYLESNVMFTGSLTGPAQSYANCYGTYGSLVWSPAPWQMKLEAKDYRNYNLSGFEFRRPPTLEEDVVYEPNIDNVSAGKLYTEYRDEDIKTTFYGSYLLGYDRLFGATQNHAVLGSKFVTLGRTEFEVKGGYRWLPGVDTMVHGQVKAKIHTFKGQAFEVGLRKWKDKNVLTSLTGIPDDRNMLDLGYTFSESLNIFMGFEYLPNGVDTGRDFVNGGVNFKTGGLVSRAFVGQTSGGVLCSGGICRVVPPYTGGYLETNYTF